MSPTVRVQVRKVEGWGEVQWHIMAETEEDAKKECEKLIEQFRPSVTPHDEWRQFKKKDKHSYICSYAYVYRRGRGRREID